MAPAQDRVGLIDGGREFFKLFGFQVGVEWMLRMAALPFFISALMCTLD